MDEILEKIIEITAEQLNVEPDTITPDTYFMDDLDADSLDLFEILMAVEEEFDVEIPEEDTEKIANESDDAYLACQRNKYRKQSAP